VTTYSSTCLAVRDDGKGFAVESVGAPDDRRPRRHRGLGLSTMQERAAALGGVVRIVSAPGQGTTVEATLPLKDDRA
jgi:signal transduction histidine kinase